MENTEPGHGHGLILVVEDDRKIASALGRGLRSAGYTMDIAHDGNDGLRKAIDGSYAAIVLDLLLPGLNGFKICAALRDAGDWTPILVLTAKDGDLDESEALDTGADDYLTKPFSMAVLLARIRALLRRRTLTAAQPITVGDLTIDVHARRCFRAGAEIDLSPREFAVLGLLAEHPGVVLSKLDILDTIWDYDFDGDPNIVEVYVARLRRKLERVGPGSIIHTVRGAGYRIDPA